MQVLLYALGLMARTWFYVGAMLVWLYSHLWPLCKISWFDHDFDFLRGPSVHMWAERGFLFNRAIPPGAKVLDVACGDGFFAHHFYSRIASQVDAFDRDVRAIRTAQRKHSRDNIRFFVADAAWLDLPAGSYDAIAMFSCIQQMKGASSVLHHLAGGLTSSGILMGSTTLSNGQGHYQTEFRSPEELRAFLLTHFASVELWSSLWPHDRHEVYFECRRLNGSRSS